MTNKVWRRLTAVAVCVLILFFGADLTLRWVSSSEWMKNYTVQKVQAATGREVRLEKMSASFMGVKADKFALSEAGGFTKGTFLSVDRLRVRVSLIHLIHGHIKLKSLIVSGLDAYLRRGANGQFNWADLSSGEAPTESEPSQTDTLSLPYLTLTNLSLKNINVFYADEQSHIQAALKNITLQGKRLVVRNLINLGFVADGFYQEGEKQYEFPVSFNVRLNLAGGDLARAQVQMPNFLLSYNGAKARINFQAQDFTAPHIKLGVTLENLTTETLKNIAPEEPAFAVSQVNFKTDLLVNLPDKKLTVNQAVLSLGGVNLSAKGGVDYRAALKYEAQADWQLDFKDLLAQLPQLAEEYQAAGTASGTAHLTQQDWQASLKAADMGANVGCAGRLEKGALDVAAQGTMDFKTAVSSVTVAGLLNKEPFSVDATWNQSPKDLFITLNALAKNLILPPLPESTQTAPAEKTDPTDKNQPSAWSLPPATVTSRIQIDALDAPYISGQRILLKADLSNLTPDMKRAHGELNLSMGNGEIKDLYKLTDANALTKVLFMSVNIVGKVFNSLNVFSVLNGIGSGLVSAVSTNDKEENTVLQTVTGPDGQPMQIRVPKTQQKIEGRMAFDKFATDVTFTKGTAAVKDGSFVSDMVSFSLNGTTDFNSGKIDMTVQAAPGKHEVDGIMPLKLNIGGTVDDPKGSMSMLGSVSSLVTQGIGNNFASRSVKKGLGGLFGIFKKKEKAPDTSAE